MLCLRNSIRTRLLSSPATSPVSLLQRLLSAAAPAPAPAVSPNPSFAVEDYLVGTCGLTRAQALKASPKLYPIKSPTKPDAVLAFLAGLGLSSADIAAAVAKDPLLLCAKVGKTLSPVVYGLTALGLSHTEIARLVSLAPASFRCRSIVSNLPYYLSLFGSYEILLRALRGCSNFLSSDLERVVKPNVALLRECGLDDCGIAKLCLAVPWLLATKVENVRKMVACAEGIGVPCDSGMFRIALQAVAFLSEEKIPAKVDYLKNTIRWSDAEVRIAVCKGPMLLTMSMDTLQRKSEFLISEIGLEPAYIAHQPAMITYSLEGRLRPRYCVVKFLKENGLLKRDPSYSTVVKITEKLFVEKFICPHKEAVPHLSGYYASACRGEIYMNQEQAMKIGQVCMAQQSVESAEIPVSVFFA
uniref:Uncharacterized protein n=1 Tax=Avena sativa TaxID=4498 RepID=A0ACD5ZAD3_AVESA